MLKVRIVLFYDHIADDAGGCDDYDDDDDGGDYGDGDDCGNDEPDQ